MQPRGSTCKLFCLHSAADCDEPPLCLDPQKCGLKAKLQREASKNSEKYSHIKSHRNFLASEPYWFFGRKSIWCLGLVPPSYVRQICAPRAHASIFMINTDKECSVVCSNCQIDNAMNHFYIYGTLPIWLVRLIYKRLFSHSKLAALPGIESKNNFDSPILVISLSGETGFTGWQKKELFSVICHLEILWNWVEQKFTLTWNFVNGRAIDSLISKYFVFNDRVRKDINKLFQQKTLLTLVGHNFFFSSF